MRQVSYRETNNTILVEGQTATTKRDIAEIAFKEGAAYFAELLDEALKTGDIEEVARLNRRAKTNSFYRSE